MSIKSSQILVEEAQKKIQTLKPDEVRSLLEKKEITLIDVRDIRELWKEGTIENSIHIPRGMLEFWLDPQSSYYQQNKIKWRCVEPAYDKDGMAKRTHGVFYSDIGTVWDDLTMGD